MASDVVVVLHLDVLYGLTRTAEMGAMLTGKAAAVLARSRAAAPVKTGHYRDSFSVAFAQTDRRVIRVHNEAPYALTVEYGGSVSVKHRTLGAALDAARGG